MPEVLSPQRVSSVDPKKQFKKPKCFNRLPQQYQWRPDLDEDHIFEGEFEMIQQLRTHFGDDLKDWSDKKVLYFLIARRDELEPAKTLIASYIKTAKAVGCFNRRTTLAENEGFKLGVRVFYRGQYDIHDRYISYFNIGKHLPKEVPRNDMMKYLIYEAQFRLDTETLRYLRNGSFEVIDMLGFGWKNMDPSPEGKETNQMLQGTFPRRIREIMVVNAGMIFKVAFRAAKLFMPKKLMKRVFLGSFDKLQETIPKENLPSQYGGSSKLTLNDFITQLEDYDREFAGMPA